jgi:hypothetical protein
VAVLYSDWFFSLSDTIGRSKHLYKGLFRRGINLFFRGWGKENIGFRTDADN